MKLITKHVLLLILFVTLTTCKENPVESLPDDNSTPGRRDYVWTADTIKAYYIYFNSIWGKKVEDLWAVSLVGSATENIYRYNGSYWYRETSVPIYNTVSLWGTENNLWICTKDGLIWNYKDGVFSSSPQFLYDDQNVRFFSMDGKNDSEIYAGGGKAISFNRVGLIYKFNNNAWQIDRVLKNYGNLFRVSYSSKNDKYYFLAYVDNIELMDTTRLLEYDNKEVKIIFSDKDADNNLIMNVIDGYLCVTIGKKIYIYYKNRFYDFLEINIPNFGGQFWGRSRNDFFIRMQDGLLHYNGTDLKYILKFSSSVTFGSSALVLDKDIFLHAFDNNTGYNIIYHGKLKEN